MEGKNIRYVVSYINKDGMRRMMSAAQGRNTHAARAEAEEDLKNVLENNTRDLLEGVFGKDAYDTFAVSAIECWPGHNDPKGIWIDEELNPGQEILRGYIRDVIYKLPCDAEALFPGMRVDVRPKYIIEDDAQKDFPLHIDCWGVAEDPKHVPGCVMCLVKFLDNSPVAVRYESRKVFKISYTPITRSRS